ncbi:MAG: hypothetical protein KDE05_05445 [Parvularculaceae bacterium]|nr:hypothetical protein [Parvularculaceae bacterium]
MTVVADDQSALIDAMKTWRDGYSEGVFQGARWGATIARGADGKRLTLFARALDGSDFISGNFYRLGSGVAARPCEMPLEKVAVFIRGFQPDAR